MLQNAWWPPYFTAILTKEGRGVANGLYSIPVAYTISAQTDFPVYVKPSAIYGLGPLSQAQADSARFYSDAAKTNELPREIVSADEIHVKADSLASSTVLHMDIDGLRADYADTDTFGTHAVWVNPYVGIWHSGGGEDSSGYSNDGQPQGGVVPGQVGGKLGRATQFDEDQEQFFLIPNNPSVDITGQILMSAWVTKSNLSQYEGVILGKSNAFVLYFWHAGGQPTNLDFYIRNGDARLSYPANNLPQGDFFKIDAVADSQTMKIFINGNEVATMSARGPTSSSKPLAIGAKSSQGGSPSKYWFDSVIDEMRLGRFSPSANWLAAEYANQSDPSTFFGTATILV